MTILACPKCGLHLMNDDQRPCKECARKSRTCSSIGGRVAAGLSDHGSSGVVADVGNLEG